MLQAVAKLTCISSGSRLQRPVGLRSTVRQSSLPVLGNSWRCLSRRVLLGLPGVDARQLLARFFKVDLTWQSAAEKKIADHRGFEIGLWTKHFWFVLSGPSQVIRYHWRAGYRWRMARARSSSCWRSVFNQRRGRLTCSAWGYPQRLAGDLHRRPA